MSYYANRRIEQLRNSLKELPPVYGMTWAEKLNYYCTLARIDELKTEWNIKDDELNDFTKSTYLSAESKNALENLWKRGKDV